MAARKIYYVAEEQQGPENETGAPVAFSDQNSYENELSEPRCGMCNELLAWHEHACSGMLAGFATPAPTEPAPKGIPLTFAYELGHLVQPIPQAQMRTIIWRGQLKERHPQTGLVHRVNVYRLDDNFWDCYHEDDLQAA